MKRILKGKEFVGKIWTILPIVIAFILAIVFGLLIAKSVPNDSLLPAVPALIGIVGILLFYIYNYRRNN